MLTLEFIPYHKIENLGSTKRINKLLKITKDNRIVLLEGRLKKQEEAELIKRTMEEIDDKFKGVELAVIYPENEDDIWFKKLKKRLMNLLLGDRQGFTVIGPATIIKEIKKDPNKIQLMTQDSAKKARRKK